MPTAAPRPRAGSATNWAWPALAALLGAWLAACAGDAGEAGTGTPTQATTDANTGAAETDDGTMAGGAPGEDDGTGGTAGGGAAVTPAGGAADAPGEDAIDGDDAVGVGAGDPAGSDDGDMLGDGDDACTRELLGATVDAYFAALAAHDPGMLPLADAVRFTENGEELTPGEGLWEHAGPVAYHHSALDTAQCTSVSEAVVPEAGVALPVALRLELIDGEIAEIETIVARPGDYVIFGSPFASDPDAIVASASLGWEQSVPEAERAGRARIETWITRYFERFPNGGCDLADDCLRLENGGGAFSCSLGASCSDGAGGGGIGGPMDARLVVVDELTGVGAGFTMFMGHVDMHMIMLRGGEVRAVHAILSAAEGPGWE